MRNVLVIAHIPRISSRVRGLVKYLPEYGWKPIILSGEYASSLYDVPCEVIKTPIRDVFGRLNKDIEPHKAIASVIGENHWSKRLMTLGGELLNYPCPDKNWKRYALEYAVKLIPDRNIEAVISTSPPVIGHIIAKELKQLFGIKWIADYRDLWSQNHNYSYSRVRRYLDRNKEKETMGAADYIVTLSGLWADGLQTLLKRPRVDIIPPGYDPVNYPEHPELTKEFTLTYTGRIYERQCFDLIFTAIKELKQEGYSIKLKMYGNGRNVVGPLAEYAEWEGFISNIETLKIQSESQVLVAFGWAGAGNSDKGMYTGKLFEYLGAKRPILYCGYPVDSVVKSLLEETGAGMYCSSIEEIKAILIRWYGEYKRSGAVSYKANSKVLRKYTHSEMARRFVELLEVTGEA